ncbi:cyclin-dependent kinase G-2 isoform X1 [Cryptomeria japonica]|uniref:cyclin-dependent kinase G-2 isoform X1 n=1 Tax=Cryptomeria japonica TaxID=3369 RepID=UPI0027DA1D40|nr:cyclin-dependent kinase G-2 isoform X1 [Cryptomeria japonica]XP_057844307.2 cyclin-dependent kinase G-2 isoform X1 [Cryptomeria japonica]XP_057844308.2 cyclin-dependent kinase G-2 isoform X1 [Cryptomeria japonica]XP_057844309.2 cyclin-dependent kinase G-2 isoform X1 [Cryptomeria japonica]XP_057844310.2 cyclin-dependent kinase G-2 isoform X1 [Cryptomeria japonica]XP_057844311.2 cyclin-dependent kinase G-2 isoform X1 [Cryptomeria japonica]XP_057844313.2 cyclin-dependent kinase G-2 isoform X1
MAAGRHGGRRDDEFRDRDSFFVKEMEDNERGRNRDGDRHRDREWENDRVRDRSRDYRPSRARHREKDHRDRNGVYASGYSSSPPRVQGDNNYSHGQASHSKDVEREPGELSSGSVSEDGGGGSWVADHGPGFDAGLGFQSSQSVEVEVRKREQMNSSPPPVQKKRKYSPIVWDLEEKPASPATAQARMVSNNLGSSSAVDGVVFSKVSPTKLPPPPPLPPSLLANSTRPGELMYLNAKITTSPGNRGTTEGSGSRVGAAVAPLKSNSPNKSAGRLFESKGCTPPFLYGGFEDSVSPPSPNRSVPGNDGNEKVDGTSVSYIPMQERRLSSLSEEEREPGQLPDSPKQLEDEEESYLPPTRYISTSRWAEEYNSPRDLKSEDEGLGKRKKQSSSMDSEEGRYSSERSGMNKQGSGQSISPEPGEYTGERLGSSRGKSRSSDEEMGQVVGERDNEKVVRGDELYDQELNERELMDLENSNDSEDVNHDQRPQSESEDEPDSAVPVEPPVPPLRTIDMLQGCRSVDEFERLNKIDEGTYGVVYRAKNKKTGEIVALKKVKMEKEREGFPLTSLREINVLLSFHHPSVVDVKEVVVGSNLDSIFMVMEYMEHDLKGLMETMKQPYSQSEVKCLMLQLFEGVKYLHDNWVLHRDLKTSNLLLNNRGELKICDFGLARQYGSPLKPYTLMVVTLWYRAPELLLGAKQYSTAIDMWSLGCIMAELLAKEPLFSGKSEIDQLDKIFRTLGTPNEKIWPDFVNLPGVKRNFLKQPYNKLRDKFPPTSFSGRPTLSESGFDLLNRLLTYDPNKRITAEEALKHEWFREVPLPKSKEFMPTFPARNDHDRRMRRILKSPDPLEEQRRKELRQGELGAGGLFC